MKKYLIKGALALVVGGFAASCADHDVDYVPIAQQRTQTYKEVFKELIGGDVDPNQNWGFEKVAIPVVEDSAQHGTRTTYKEQHDWVSLGATKPDALSSSEINSVVNYFQTTSFSNSGLSISESEFWVEFVYKEPTTSDKYYKDGSSTDWNDVSFTYDKIGLKSNGNPWYTADDGYEDINDWNASTHPTVFLKYVSAQFRAYLSLTSEWNTKYTIQKYNGNYYVGFDLYGSKWNDYGEEHYGERTQGYYSDYIIRLVPKNGGDFTTGGSSGGGGGSSTGGTSITKTHRIDTYTGKILQLQGRVMCEDLGSFTSGTVPVVSDIDFNDIVFDARIWQVFNFTREYVDDEYLEGSESEHTNIRYEAEICLLAAGGTCAAKVGGQDAQTVNSFFGVNSEVIMVNTVDDRSASEMTAWDTEWATIEYRDTKAPVTFTVDITDYVNDLPVVNGVRELGLDVIPIWVTWKDVDSQNYGTMQTVGDIQATPGEAPQKICVKLGTLWPRERCAIAPSGDRGGAYAYFADWAKAGSSSNIDFTDLGDDEYLYLDAPTGLAELSANYYQQVGNPVEGEPWYETIYIPGEPDDETNTSNTETVNPGNSVTTNEIVLWSGVNTYENSESGSNGNSMSFKSIYFNAGDKLRVYGSKTANSAWLELKNVDWGKVADVDLSSLDGYTEIEMTQNIIN